MIQANELRIGNIVSYNYDEIKVHSLSFFLRNMVNGYDLFYIKPIPLTEEKLIEYGATEIVRLSDDYTRYDLKGIHFSICPERDFFIEYVHQIPIKHVHTLQNFYFATRQQELVLSNVPEATKPAL